MSKILFPIKEECAANGWLSELLNILRKNFKKCVQVKKILEDSRQNTWFKKKRRHHWFNYQTGASAIIDFIKEKNAAKGVFYLILSF